jgi:hypothetical protein
MNHDSLPVHRRSTGGVIPWLLLALLAGAAVGAALFKAWPLLHPDTVARAPLNADCDLRVGPCSVRFPGGGEVRLGIEPREIPVMRPLGVSVELTGIDAHRIEVDFSGVDMNMGYNRVGLTAVGQGRFEGEAILPVCVRDRMTWEALVLADTPAGLLGAPFRFDTTRP